MPLRPPFMRSSSEVHGQVHPHQLGSKLSIRVHDALPPAESAIVDDGIGRSNAEAAPLHEVTPLSCFAHSERGDVIGGAVGRCWGHCCELQQLWVDPAHRRHGIGTRLIGAFEARAQARGCTIYYLETFSFQAPHWYRSLGYVAACELKLYPHAITRFIMVKHTVPASAAP